MSKGPAIFSEIGKQAEDILRKDYSFDKKLTIATHSDTGVGLISIAVEMEGLSSRDVAAQYKYSNVVVDAKVDTESNISTTLTVTDIMPSTKTIASFKLPDYKSGKLEVQYFHEFATFTTAVDLNWSPAVDLSATIGTPDIAIGAEATYVPASSSFMKFNAGVSLKKPNSIYSLILADRGDSLRMLSLCHLDQLKRVTVVREISRRLSTNVNTITAGFSYAVDPQRVLKAKFDNHGKLGALLQHELKPKSFLTISGAFDAMALETKFRFGLTLALMP